jgi:hypothetical protein
MRDIYANAGPGCKADNQAAYERDSQINKITPDPVLPCLGGSAMAWPGADWGRNAGAAVMANPINVIPGHESEHARLAPAPGNTYRVRISVRR